MSDAESLETRVEMLEVVLARQIDAVERNRYEIRALTAALAAVIDINRPDDDATAAKWFDAMAEVATRNVGLHAELAADAIIRDHGLDSEMLEAMEDERKAVTGWLEAYFAGLKTPVGGLEPG